MISIFDQNNVFLYIKKRKPPIFRTLDFGPSKVQSAKCKVQPIIINKVKGPAIVTEIAFVVSDGDLKRPI